MSSSQQLSHHDGEVTGQVQLKKEEYLNNVSHAMHQNADHHTHSHSQSDQNNPSLISQASNVISQTGGQVVNMAQGAADAVKNTLGMSPSGGNTNNPRSPSGTNRSSNPGSKNT